MVTREERARRAKASAEEATARYLKRLNQPPLPPRGQSAKRKLTSEQCRWRWFENGKILSCKTMTEPGRGYCARHPAQGSSR